MSSKLVVPFSVVLAGILIAGAIVYTGRTPDGTTAAVHEGATEENANTVGDMRPLNEEDWRRGPQDATVTLVEYSDLECPFCQRFHDTMKRVREEYPDNVAWVWRNFPIEQLHAKAPQEAEAAECVGSLGGNEAFWSFVDTIYEEGPMNDGLDLSRLPDFAVQAGVERDAFQQCLDSGEMKQKVDEDYADAQEAGSNISRLGTPFSVIVAGDRRVPMVGAQPFSAVKQTIDALLEEQN